MSELHVDSIRKRFGDKQILNDIFISCKPGQIIALLGRNGSGKSTLLKIIFGSLSADNKFIKVDDRKIDSLYQKRKLIHYLAQDNFLPNHVKIKNIIRCFCDTKNAALIMGNDLIIPFLQKKVNQLSGGEKRIMEILLVVHSNVKYVLLDEPFNGSSPLHIEIIKELIKEHSKNKGFIITDHDYKNVLDISSTVILMDSGNTRVIKEFSELIDYGYLPATSERTQHP
ncbi:ABC transporter ATP-binding protein [Arcticibacter svalbardensis MN12-7]|uniref:ABC transporter ATP-binding protein n=1 Tax=Arcticibacter svalbardensis MN12-7 TaxID=1150600 RepID=R9GWV1_9SPHI|nr:ATP-binding cassette domain-containing protein [Arcticibacter svalbardensis]EOR96221.1 ABC transporter ATP-binding protein [Arcticibacter svalbardensis MN12-7]